MVILSFQVDDFPKMRLVYGRLYSNFRLLYRTMKMCAGAMENYGDMCRRYGECAGNSEAR